MGLTETPAPEAGSADRLRNARYVATCYLEHHPGVYHDVFDEMRGLFPKEADPGLLAAAALYTPVVHVRPAEWRIERGFGHDVFRLLMETTYDPALGPQDRLAAMTERLPMLSDRGLILQVAALKAYFEQDVYLHSRVCPDGDLDYCRWLEGVLTSLSDICPELAARTGRMLAFYLRRRADAPFGGERSAGMAGWVRSIFTPGN